ncbi:PAS domain S-box protein [Thalassoroseus pseudoceratinae]|uniref:PAS domain S-box protein n=1 Tax=Thalassoroseus pseudoceratinae TaxID=2713176 RepID=UPI00142264EC|nr:PAS domain S-box protein [Thalassoroseus pseudoceratinae]
MTNFEADKNLLFGVIAMQCDLIDMRQFVDACTLWSSRKESTLAEILVQQGWLDEEDREHVEYLLKRRIDKQGGDVRKSLASMPDDVKAALSGIENDSIIETIQELADNDRWKTTVAIEPPEEPSDKVTLKGLHSTGGIGQVWIAEDQILKREIALKELKTDMARSQKNRHRFFREAQLTAQLEHPGIVPVYDYRANEQGSRCYYTMRFIKGRTLTEVVNAYHAERKKADTLQMSELIKLLGMFINICQTIAYAHSRNVIHRDLKGDNVVVGDFGEVIVLDWGLAKRLDEILVETVLDDEYGATIITDDADPTPSNATMQGEKLGTPAYMAPEQALGHIDRIDQRTDIYGLAAILYEILTGEPPFTGKSIVKILDAVIHDTPKRPSEIVPDLPTELERICLQGLAKDRKARPESATELAEQIQNWIAERADRKRTEQERERFFSLSLDLLAILDAEGTLSQTNPAWEKVLGWTSSELEGQTVRSLLHPDDQTQLANNLKRILAGESLTEVEHRCRCRDGSYRWILWNASLIAGEGSIYLVGRDITERKQTEQTFQELLESAPDGMVIVNDQGQIVLVNAQIEHLFGFDRQELLGQPIETLVPEEVRERHPAYVRKYISEPECRPMASGLELYGRRKNGDVFPAEISLSPVQTEQGLLISCAIRDVTGRHGTSN